MVRAVVSKTSCAGSNPARRANIIVNLIKTWHVTEQVTKEDLDWLKQSNYDFMMDGPEVQEVVTLTNSSLSFRYYPKTLVIFTRTEEQETFLLLRFSNIECVRARTEYRY